jgi:hypothetical protein
MLMIAAETSARFRDADAGRRPARGTCPAQDLRVVALIFLAIGLVCAVIGRILLIGAAFGVSIWWGLGVFLPFGPLLFRLSYPDLAPLSRKFRFATLPCIFVYFVLSSPRFSASHQRQFFHLPQFPSGPAEHYGLEKADQPAKTMSVEERRTANSREFERLWAWSEKLHLQKRDLLHSDAEGNLVYDIELRQYKAALDKANAEKNAVWPLTK